VTSSGPRHAHLEGCDLHANQAVPADDRTALERLCRYILRPPIAQDRLQLTPDGRVAVALKTAWADGTTHLLFEPVELLTKLAVLTPRPRINLLLYHGVLAPHARWRRDAVARDHDERLSARPSADSPAPAAPRPVPPPVPADGAPPAHVPHHTSTPRHQTWANLMRRAFALDVL